MPSPKKEEECLLEICYLKIFGIDPKHTTALGGTLSVATLGITLPLIAGVFFCKGVSGPEKFIFILLILLIGMPSTLAALSIIGGIVYRCGGRRLFGKNRCEKTAFAAMAISIIYSSSIVYNFVCYPDWPLFYGYSAIYEGAMFSTSELMSNALGAGGMSVRDASAEKNTKRGYDAELLLKQVRRSFLMNTQNGDYIPISSYIEALGRVETGPDEKSSKLKKK